MNEEPRVIEWDELTPEMQEILKRASESSTVSLPRRKRRLTEPVDPDSLDS